MKMNKNVIAVLKNYSSINQGITVQAGSVLETISIDQSIYTKYDSENTSPFPHEFSIYDLNGFLSVISLFDDPEFKFEEHHVQIGQGNERVIYYYSDPSAIDSPPETVQFPPVDFEFFLGAEKLSKLLKAANVLGSTSIRFEADGDNKVVATVFDRNGASDNTFSLDVDQFNGSDFDAVVDIATLKVMGGSYIIGIKGDAFIEMTSEKESIKYYISQIERKHLTNPI